MDRNPNNELKIITILPLAIPRVLHTPLSMAQTAVSSPFGTLPREIPEREFQIQPSRLLMFQKLLFER
jgi:hypothetical protein